MIIGFAGKRGAGKTTNSILLKDVYQYDIRNFATPLREELCDYINHNLKEILLIIQERASEDVKSELYYTCIKWSGNLTPEHMSTPGIKEEFRKLQQFWGTDFRRTDDPLHWIKKMNWEGDFSIADVRFNEEAGSELKAIRDRDGTIVYVFDEEKEKEVVTHSSESLSHTECDHVLLWDKRDNESSVNNFVSLMDKLGFDNPEAHRATWLETLNRM